MATETALGFLRALPRVPLPASAVVIAGAQPFLREYTLERLRTRFVAEGFSYRSFQVGGADRVEGLLNELEGGDLFASKRLLTCRLLRSFRDRGGAADEASQEAPTGSDGRAESVLIDACGRLNPTLRLVIVAERENAPAKIRRAVEQKGIVVNCPRPFDNQLGQYTDLFARDAGFKLAATATERLITRYGSDLGAIANAISRAAVTAEPGANLEAGVFDESGSSMRSPDLFELADAVARGDAAEGLALADRAIQTGRDPIEMLAIEVIPQLRRMLIAAEVLAARRGTSMVASALALPPSSTMVSRAIDGAQRFGVVRLRTAHQRATTLDEHFKMGLIKERDQALMGLLLDLMASVNREPTEQ